MKYEDLKDNAQLEQYLRLQTRIGEHIHWAAEREKEALINANYKLVLQGYSIRQYLEDTAQ